MIRKIFNTAGFTVGDSTCDVRHVSGARVRRVSAVCYDCKLAIDMEDIQHCRLCSGGQHV